MIGAGMEQKPAVGVVIVRFRDMQLAKPVTVELLIDRHMLDATFSSRPRKVGDIGGFCQLVVEIMRQFI